jgi:hypothetical protein
MQSNNSKLFTWILVIIIAIGAWYFLVKGGENKQPTISDDSVKEQPENEIKVLSPVQDYEITPIMPQVNVEAMRVSRVSQGENVVINGQFLINFVINNIERTFSFGAAPDHEGVIGTTSEERFEKEIKLYAADGPDGGSRVTSVKKVDSFATNFSDNCIAFDVTYGYFKYTLEKEILEKSIHFPSIYCDIKSGEKISYPFNATHFVFEPVFKEYVIVSQTQIKEAIKSFDVRKIEWLVEGKKVN